MAGTQGSVLRRRVLGIASLALAAAAWFFFAPQAVGGNVSYTVVTGQSMQPGLHASDLVIVRERPGYGIGDAVAYRSRHLGQVVLHRIVAVEDGRFVMQGDNNDFFDSDRPAPADVLGAHWLRVPKAGLAFTFFRTPTGIALGAVGILGSMGFFSVTKRRRRRKGRHLRERPDPSEALEPGPVARNGEPVERGPRTGRAKARRPQVAIVACAATTAAFALLSVAAFGRPLFRTEPSEIVYVHAGEFDYSAPAPEGPVYQKPEIGAGDPVFVRLVRDIDLAFRYSLESDAESDLDVSGSMVARLYTDNGWERRVDIGSATASSDGRLGLKGSLDLNEIKRVLSRVEAMTGMVPGTYSIAIEPRVDVAGKIGGEPIRDSFAPSLPFELTDIQLGLVRLEESGRLKTLEQILRPTEKETVRTTVPVSNPFTILGRAVPVLSARRLGLYGSALSFLALIVLSVIWLRRRPVDEAARIQARFGSLIVSVSDGPDLTQETVDVTDFHTLARLAQQFEQPIMHRSSDDGHSYSLYYDGLLYRFRLGDRRVAARVEPIPFKRPVHAVLTRPPKPPRSGDDEQISG